MRREITSRTDAWIRWVGLILLLANLGVSALVLLGNRVYAAKCGMNDEKELLCLIVPAQRK